jgi:hypothetical protein
MVATYAWDMLGSGFPFDPIQVEIRALGIMAPLPRVATPRCVMFFDTLIRRAILACQWRV